MHWNRELPYFAETELRCQCGCGQLRLDIHFAAALPALRLAWGGPLIPNSVSRCREHNNAIPGHPRSLHLIDNPVHETDGAAAADITWRNWPIQTKLRFARLAWSMGWSVGLHDGFCHVDRRADVGLAQSVFLYGDWSGDFGPDDVTQ